MINGTCSITAECITYSGHRMRSKAIVSVLYKRLKINHRSTFMQGDGQKAAVCDGDEDGNSVCSFKPPPPMSHLRLKMAQSMELQTCFSESLYILDGQGAKNIPMQQLRILYFSKIAIQRSGLQTSLQQPLHIGCTLTQEI